MPTWLAIRHDEARRALVGDRMRDEASYVSDSCGEEIVLPIEVSAGSEQEYVEDWVFHGRGRRDSRPHRTTLLTWHSWLVQRQRGPVRDWRCPRRFLMPT